MTPKLFRIEPPPGTSGDETAFINLDMVVMVNLRGNRAIIMLSIEYASIPTTRACGERLIELMGKDDGK